MRTILCLVVVAALIAAAGCSKKQPPAPEPATPADNATVSGPCDTGDNATTPKKGRFERAGVEAGKMLKEGAHKAGEVAAEGAVEAGKALDKASEKTGDTLIRTGKWLKDDNTTDNK